MKKHFNLAAEDLSNLKKELVYILISFFAAIAIFKLAFYNENLLNVLKIVLSLFWLFILPGYFLMIYWREKLDFVERFIIGIALCLGLVGSTSYYLGLAGLNIKYHTVLLPLILILVGLIINLRNNEAQKS